MIAGFVGVHPETGLRRGASWRTPPDTSTTDPTSPNALRHTTPLGCSEPGAHRVDLAPGNDIEQLPAFHVDDLRGSTLAPVGAFTLVSVSSNPTAVTIANPGGITCQHLPEQDNSVRHCVPNQPRVLCDFRHRPPGFADLDCRLPGHPCRQRGPFRRDRRVLFAPRHHRIRPVRITPPLRVPHQPRRTPEHRQSTSKTSR